MSALGSLALASGIVCALAPLAQAARIGSTGSADDVSLIWLCLYAAGSIVWVAYGAAIGSLPLLISQAIALASVGVALLLVGRYRHTRQPSGINGARPRPRDSTAHNAVDQNRHAGRERAGAPGP
jgi:MtN3 and saliva related transmembrane protein